MRLDNTCKHVAERTCEYPRHIGYILFLCLSAVIPKLKCLRICYAAFAHKLKADVAAELILVIVEVNLCVG